MKLLHAQYILKSVDPHYVLQPGYAGKRFTVIHHHITLVALGVVASKARMQNLGICTSRLNLVMSVDDSDP